MKFKFKPNSHIDRIHRILNFDLGKSAPTPTYLFPDFVASLSILGAILLTPVILWSLFRLKRYGWLLSFFILIVVPYLSIDYFAGGTSWHFVLMIIPLLFLAAYYFILRLTIPNWKEPIFINKPGSDFE